MAGDPESVDEKLTKATGSHDHRQSHSSKSHETVVDQDTKDNVVDWDGPDDPENPRNWSTWKRMTQVVIASAFLLTA
jgi:hypothetical protein